LPQRRVGARHVHVAQQSIDRRPRQKATRRQSSRQGTMTTPPFCIGVIHLRGGRCIERYAFAVQRCKEARWCEARVDGRIVCARAVADVGDQ
jgi:hypothetical protein